jgi:hypothetical protein
MYYSVQEVFASHMSLPFVLTQTTYEAHEREYADEVTRIHTGHECEYADELASDSKNKGDESIECMMLKQGV